MRRESCLFYMQGRCRFGERCRFSHEGFLQGLMIRHAQSEFNFASQSIPSHAFFEEKAKEEFQLNINYIDCKLSEQGEKQARQVQLPKQYLDNKRNIDVIFVSPLERTLKTAEIIIDSYKLKVGIVVVLPEITEVLSKVCDFGSSLSSKKQRFPQFDFDEMIRFLRHNKIENESHWQDALVDKEYRGQINREEQFGHRYMKILKEIFPTPLESSDSCFDRSLKALEIMKAIVEHLKAKKILIISHNRVLKYLDGRFNKGRSRSFGNCQVRSLIF